jgi:hypothetical protein
MGLVAADDPALDILEPARLSHSSASHTTRASTLHPAIPPTISVISARAPPVAEAEARRRLSQWGAVWGLGGGRYETKGWRGNALALERRAVREGRRLRDFCASMADLFEDHPA